MVAQGMAQSLAMRTFVVKVERLKWTTPIVMSQLVRMTPPY